MLPQQYTLLYIADVTAVDQVKKKGKTICFNLIQGNFRVFLCLSFMQVILCQVINFWIFVNDPPTTPDNLCLLLVFSHFGHAIPQHH